MEKEEKIPGVELVPTDVPNQFEFVQVDEIEKKKIEVKHSQLKVKDFSISNMGTINIEEDVLVPDTKPDLRDILLMDVTIEDRNSLLIKVTYLPEKEDELVAIETRIPIAGTAAEKIKSSISTEEVKLSVEQVEYLVINERKFRVKIGLKGRRLEQRTLEAQLFDKEDKKIQLKKEAIDITELSLKKDDSLEIDEEIHFKESMKHPVKVLGSNIQIIPGFKQITAEKIVINGNVHLSLLFLSEDEQGEMDYEQLQSKVEFTQFIPIEGKGQYSASEVSFEKSDLWVEISEEEESEQTLKLKGRIVASTQLYKNTQAEVVVDGYHMEDELSFEKQHINYKTLVGNGASEVSCREIVTISEGQEAVERVIFTEGKPIEIMSQAGKGKVNTSCLLHGNILWKDTEGGINKIHLDIPIKGTVDVPGAKEGDLVSETVAVKDIWAEKINSNQMEYNCTLIINVQVMEMRETVIVSNPTLTKASEPRKSAMTVYITRNEDSLWKIAKKYKTTVAKIQEINNLETEELAAGKKILIVK